MAEFEEVDGFDQSVESLETTLGAASGMTQAFEAELARMQLTMNGTTREVGILSRGISRGLKRA